MNLGRNTNKSKVWLVIVLVILIIVLISGGIFAYLYLKTDMFKSNEELFWKYMGQNLEMIDIIKYEPDSRYENRSYIENMKIEFQMKDTQLQYLDNLTVSIATKNNNDTKSTYSKINAQYKNQQLLEMEYLKNNETYALKNTEVANGYIAVENKDLKSIVEHFNIGTQEIPNKIEKIDYSEIFNIGAQEKQHIFDIYYGVVKNSINKKKYTKTKNVELNVEENKYMTNAYSVTLTQREYQNLLINSLETLKTDSITLNLITTKMKNINKDSKYTNINELNQEIAHLIEEIKQKQSENQDYIKFTVYESNGKVISTRIEKIGKSKILITYIKEQNKILIEKENLENNNSEKNEWNKISIINRNNNEEQYFLVEVKYMESNLITIEIKKEKTDSGYGIDGVLEIYGNVIRLKGEKVLSQSEDIPVIKDSTNIVLNEIQDEKLNILITQLEEQILKVLEEKKQIVNPTVISTPEPILEII